MTGEHARGAGDESLSRQVLESTRGRRVKHRPRLGAMSTSLLDSLLTDHLDHGYAEAAARKAERAAGDEAPGAARRTGWVLAVGLLLVGFLLAAAARSTAQQAPDSERARQALVRDVESGTVASDALQRRAESLRTQLVRERNAVLAASVTGDQVSRQLRELERAAALVPVTGPGIAVVFGDASPREQLDPATGEPQSVPPEDSGRLRDVDLQSVVNALWAASAEAVAINGKRLAPTTTIRAAGEAILVDLFPVSSPYTIEAIGAPDTLLPRFADSAASRRYQSQAGVFGIRFEVRRSGDLSLPAATGTDLRYAQPLRPSSGATTPPGSGTGSGRPSTGSPGSITPSGGTGSPGTGGGS